MISCRRLASVTTLSVVIALFVSDLACAAGNATQTFVGPGPWIDVADPAYGAGGTAFTKMGPPSRPRSRPPPRRSALLSRSRAPRRYLPRVPDPDSAELRKVPWPVRGGPGIVPARRTHSAPH